MMPDVDVKKTDGTATGTALTLDARLFGVRPNVPVMHQVVNAQLAARRAGTQSTKTRAEVAGGGAKPYKQKGTGRARQGSTRAPHWTGGGVAFGPKPRSYKQRTPKKMIRLALASALSDRASEAKVVVLDGWGFGAPSTRAAIEVLDALQLEGRILVVVSRDDDLVVKSLRNLQHVQLIFDGELNAYDVLCNDWVVFTRDTLPGTSTDAAAAADAAAVTEADPAAVTEADSTEADSTEADATDTAAAEASAQAATGPHTTDTDEQSESTS